VSVCGATNTVTCTPKRATSARIANDHDYVMCCPGAAFGAAKLWPPERFAAALDRLHELHGWRGVVSGGPGEEALMEAVATSPAFQTPGVRP
jgi:ADP-heptose:LPS heptosyltransferase